MTRATDDDESSNPILAHIETNTSILELFSHFPADETQPLTTVSYLWTSTRIDLIRGTLNYLLESLAYSFRNYTPMDPFTLLLGFEYKDTDDGINT